MLRQALRTIRSLVFFMALPRSLRLLHSREFRYPLYPKPSPGGRLVPKAFDGALLRIRKATGADRINQQEELTDRLAAEGGECAGGFFPEERFAQQVRLRIRVYPQASA